MNLCSCKEQFTLSYMAYQPLKDILPPNIWKYSRQRELPPQNAASSHPNVLFHSYHWLDCRAALSRTFTTLVKYRLITTSHILRTR